MHNLIYFTFLYCVFFSATSLIDSRTRKLLDDNIKILQQIAANLNYNEIHNNNDLFCRSKQNLAAILNRMNGMAGIMSQMPPLPVNIDDNLMSLLPCITHAQRLLHIFGLLRRLEALVLISGGFGACSALWGKMRVECWSGQGSEEG
ncbi:hypothetical protein ZIOFF_008197 [Zingiber officinale]|uniref:Uncharacterized protein n=1 Tax=Zingiber officinale TaxID=94328 RepID=A0A8J5M585_ZINOF|nr:hypothetical protein ZIOFF_008197 [Zingiber officinale]